MRLRRAINALAEKQKSLSPEEFAKAYRATLLEVQNDLRGQGDAPVASNDTAAADLHRLPYVKQAWGAV
jgi:hypothetical protein